MSLLKALYKTVRNAKSKESWGRCAALVLVVTAACVLLGPVALGGTLWWARHGLELGLAIAGTYGVLKGKISTPLRLAIVCVAMLCVQVTPLPVAIVNSFFPRASAEWHQDDQDLAGHALSVSPADSAIGLRRLFLALLGIHGIATAMNSPKSRRWVGTAVAVSAVVVISSGLLVKPNQGHEMFGGLVSLKGRIDGWRTADTGPHMTSGAGYVRNVAAGPFSFEITDWVIGDISGTYIISNHFAGAVILTVPFLQAAATAAGARFGLPSWFCYPQAILIACAGLWVTYDAGSRAGSCCLIVSQFLFISLSIRRSKLSRVFAIVASLSAIGVIAVAWLMYGPGGLAGDLLPEVLKSRFGSYLVDGRAAVTRAAVEFLRRSPVFGTGLNTFGLMYGFYYRPQEPWYYAHNDLAQFLSETGFVGFVMLCIATHLFVKSMRAVSAVPEEVDRQFVVAAIAAIAGISLHSLFDWNLHVPANAFLAIVALGILVSWRREKEGEPEPLRPMQAAVRPFPRFWRLPPGAGRVGLAGVAVVCLCFLFRDGVTELLANRLRCAITCYRIESGRDALPPSPNKACFELDLAEYEDLAKFDPWNAKFAMLLGQNYLLAGAQHSSGSSPDAARLYARSFYWFDKARKRCAILLGQPSRKGRYNLQSP